MTEHNRAEEASSCSIESEFDESAHRRNQPQLKPDVDRDTSSQQVGSRATVASHTNPSSSITQEDDAHEEEIVVHPLADAIEEELDIVTLPDPDGFRHDDDPEIAVLPETNNQGAESSTTPPVVPCEQDMSFPDAFYCTLTWQLMKDPVVLASGESYDRKNILAAQEEGGEEVICYPNRALKSIIQQELERMRGEGEEEPSGAFQTTLRHLDETIRSVSERFFDNNNTSSSTEAAQQQHRPLPDALFCPITLDLIQRPVIEPDGYTYERKAIIQWIRQHGTSPNTRQPLSIDQLFPNLAIQQLIDEEKAKPDELMHPTIKSWKENPPSLTDDDDDDINTSLDLEAGNISTNYPVTPPPPSIQTHHGYGQTHTTPSRRESWMRAFQLILMLLLFGIAVFFLLFFPSIIASLLCMALVLHYGNRALQQYNAGNNPDETRAQQHAF